MGTGIDMARVEAPEHAAAIENMRDQLLIVLLQRLGGEATIPVAEVDGSGGLVMKMALVDYPSAPKFHFKIEMKQ